ncbi:hypothetical protein GKZ68_20945 (plasmid) [Hymenobacter sp. BRD128]|uniref:hypothetical protein n=1 Tax=Hymenobacter sp. BRD128 TaxID=2675878 RepID=UPI0015660305|nr:hypothetical protein [Hymenobacter sp. BRD128]QKG59150.1 hypothetical protein GKZ68_20945 [Hymenobacter sp. BRD128]
MRTPPAAPSLPGRLLLAGLLWLVSLLLLGLVNVAGAARYDALPQWLALLELSWALLQGLSLLRLLYCL